MYRKKVFKRLTTTGVSGMGAGTAHSLMINSENQLSGAASSDRSSQKQLFNKYYGGSASNANRSPLLITKSNIEENPYQMRTNQSELSAQQFPHTFSNEDDLSNLLNKREELKQPQLNQHSISLDKNSISTSQFRLQPKNSSMIVATPGNHLEAIHQQQPKERVSIKPVVQAKPDNNNSSNSQSIENSSGNASGSGGIINSLQQVGAQQIRVSHAPPSLSGASQQNKNIKVNVVRVNTSQQQQERGSTSDRPSSNLFGFDFQQIQDQITNALGFKQAQPHNEQSNQSMRQAIGGNEISAINDSSSIQIKGFISDLDENNLPSMRQKQQKTPSSSLLPPQEVCYIGVEIDKILRLMQESKNTNNYLNQIQQLDIIGRKIQATHFKNQTLQQKKIIFMYFQELFNIISGYDKQVDSQVLFLLSLLSSEVPTITPQDQLPFSVGAGSSHQPAVPTNPVNQSHQRVISRGQPSESPQTSVNDSQLSRQPPKQRQTLSQHPELFYQKAHDSDEEEAYSPADEPLHSEEIFLPQRSGGIKPLNASSNKQQLSSAYQSQKSSALKEPLRVSQQLSENRIEERLRKKQEEVELEVKRRKMELEKEQVMYFQEVYNEVKKEPMLAQHQSKIRMIQISALYEKCKANKVIKDQFRNFVIKEFQKCIQQIVKSGHETSRSPDPPQTLVMDQFKYNKSTAAAPTIVEHREKNIFQGRKRSKSKSSLGAAAVSSGPVSNFAVIKEYEDEEESQRGTDKKPIGAVQIRNQKRTNMFE